MLDSGFLYLPDSVSRTSLLFLSSLLCFQKHMGNQVRAFLFRSPDSFMGLAACIAPGPVRACEWWWVRFANLYALGDFKCSRTGCSPSPPFPFPPFPDPSAASLPADSGDPKGGRELLPRRKKSHSIAPAAHTEFSAARPRPSSDSLGLKHQPNLKHPSRFEGGWAGQGVILGAASEIQWPC